MKELDLHGFTHADARRETISFIEASYNKVEILTIITGNSIQMKNVVLEVLREYSIVPNILQLRDTQIMFTA